MVVGLLGMSGAGKSHLSQLLSGAGFLRVDCDSLIAERMRHEVAGIVCDTDVGPWMGLPDAPGFAERERRFLAYERAVLEAVVEQIAGGALGRDVVLDMGGSAIYADDVLARLRSLATLVYLAITPEMHAHMLQSYLACPKSLVWQGQFQPLPGEARPATFARCYAALIAWREARYAALSDITLESAFYRRPGLTAEELLRHLAAARSCASAEP